VSFIDNASFIRELIEISSVEARKFINLAINCYFEKSSLRLAMLQMISASSTLFTNSKFLSFKVFFTTG
jgi:hypothetical protein